REGRPATADEPGPPDLVDDLLRTDPAGPLEGPEPARGPVRVERRRIDDANPRQEPKAGLAGLRDSRRDRVGLVLLATAVARIRSDRAGQPAGHTRRVDRAGDERPRL